MLGQLNNGSTGIFGKNYVLLNEGFEIGNNADVLIEVKECYESNLYNFFPHGRTAPPELPPQALDRLTTKLMKRIFLLLYLIICFGLKAQTYYFDSVLVGSYKGELHQYQLADTTITSVCYNDTLNINEGNFPNSSYLKAKDSCYNTTPGGDLIQYYADTSFVRLPYPSCECFNGKYYSFNDSLKLRYFDLPDNTRFFWFYGRKYWSPVTGWVGIKRGKYRNRRN